MVLERAALAAAASSVSGAFILLPVSRRRYCDANG
jgi:hypothetical protein